LAGVALGVWFGMVDPTVPLIAVSLAVAAAIFWLKENTSLVTDSIMAMLLSGSVAAGIVILKMLKTKPGDLHGFLFGDILAVGWPDVWQAAALCLIVGGGFFWRLSDLCLLTAHEEIARVCGVRVRQLNYLFVLLVIPPAAASNLSRNLRQQIVLSVLAGLLGGIGGIALAWHLSVAWHLDVPCGAAIVLASLGLFVVTLVAGRVRDASFRRPAPARST